MANFSGTPTSGAAASGGDLHRLLHQHADLVVVELRGQQHLHGAEPKPYVLERGFLHGGPDGDEHVWQQHEHQEQLHHRRQWPPVANFSGTPTIGAPPLAVSFTDSSTNTPTAWSWTFGDSQLLHRAEPEPLRTPARAPTPSPSPPPTPTGTTRTPRTTTSPSERAGGELLRHADQRQRALDGDLHRFLHQQPTAWSWTFGDSNTSTAQNPSHTYNTAGATPWR